MPARDLPILLPCHGASAHGVHADAVAEELAERGLVEVVEDIEQIVAAARAGREVIALDGCAASCQARLLDASGVQTLRALNLSESGTSEQQMAATESVRELEAATHPVRRTRRTLSVPSSELSGRGTHTVEDYLLALDTLTSPVVECGAVVDSPTLAAHVAQILGLSRPAVGEMVARLEESGYIHRGAHKDVLLTPAGRVQADRVLHKQRVLECFVVETLGYPVDECYERARELSPGFDEEALERMWVALGRPDHCPHGWPVEPERSHRENRGLVALSAVPDGMEATVERLDESSSERLRALAASGIELGLRVGGVTVNTAAETVGFLVGGERRSISTALATSVLVRSA